MQGINITELGANVNITLKQGELYQFAENLLDSAIERVRAEIALHPTDVYYTIKQVAQMLSVDRTTLYKWSKIGYLTPLKFGGQVRYRKSDIEALVEERKG